jgi:hypothetical protein
MKESPLLKRGLGLTSFPFPYTHHLGQELLGWLPAFGKKPTTSNKKSQTEFLRMVDPKSRLDQLII